MSLWNWAQNIQERVSKREREKDGDSEHLICPKTGRRALVYFMWAYTKHTSFRSFAFYQMYKQRLIPYFVVCCYFCVACVCVPCIRSFYFYCFHIYMRIVIVYLRGHSMLIVPHIRLNLNERKKTTHRKKEEKMRLKLKWLNEWRANEQSNEFWPESIISSSNFRFHIF